MLTITIKRETSTEIFHVDRFVFERFSTEEGSGVITMFCRGAISNRQFEVLQELSSSPKREEEGNLLEVWSQGARLAWYRLEKEVSDGSLEKVA